MGEMVADAVLSVGVSAECLCDPTPTILAPTYRTADAIVNRYLKNLAPLA